MSNAASIIEAESPKKAIKAAQERWHEVAHEGQQHLRREGWTFETWFYENGNYRFYLEKTNENPADPNFFRWRIGIKGIGEDRWRTSGSLKNEAGEVERGLPFEEALKRAIKWANQNIRPKDKLSESDEVSTREANGAYLQQLKHRYFAAEQE